MNGLREGSVVMGSLRLAGALWIIAGVVCSGLLIFVFVGENLGNLGVLVENPALPALVAAGAIVGLLIGVLLIARPGPEIVRWSTVAGVTWLMVFGTLALTRLDRPGPLLSTSLITVFGVAGAIAAYRSRTAVGSPEYRPHRKDGGASGAR